MYTHSGKESKKGNVLQMGELEDSYLESCITSVYAV